MSWIDVNTQLPEPLEDVTVRPKEKALLLYTPKDGMIHVGYRVKSYHYQPNKLNWIVVTSTPKSYQALKCRVSHWMPCPLPPIQSDMSFLQEGEYK